MCIHGERNDSNRPFACAKQSQSATQTFIIARTYPLRLGIRSVPNFGMSSDDQDTAVSNVKRSPPVQGECDRLLVVARRAGPIGRVFKLIGSRLNIGRDSSNDIVLEEDENISRHHCKLERIEDRLLVTDVGSRNGTLLNDSRLLAVAELKTGDTLMIGSTLLKYWSAAAPEAELFEQVYQMAFTDGLTGLKNKQHLTEQLTREVLRARRYNRSLALLMIDIDFFKKVNDTHGHQAGDRVLRTVAKVISRCVRDEDVVARYGGEEMAVLLLECTLETARETAERIRAAVAASVAAWEGKELQVTISVGCAALSDDDANGDALVGRADKQLYEAKHAGRNRVC
jgi:two-component system, cell cycle response regulator